VINSTEFQDPTLTCGDWSDTFTRGAGEQEFFCNKEFTEAMQDLPTTQAGVPLDGDRDHQR